MGDFLTIKVPSKAVLPSQAALAPRLRRVIWPDVLQKRNKRGLEDEAAPVL